MNTETEKARSLKAQRLGGKHWAGHPHRVEFEPPGVTGWEVLSNPGPLERTMIRNASIWYNTRTNKVYTRYVNPDVARYVDRIARDLATELGATQ